MSGELDANGSQTQQEPTQPKCPVLTFEFLFFRDSSKQFPLYFRAVTLLLQPLFAYFETRFSGF